MTWWNDRMMPISSTAMIRPLSHGLARKALKIWRCSTNAIRPHRIRNTSIRMRKMRGDESFVRSFPIGPVQRAESPPNNGTARVTGERMFGLLDHWPQLRLGQLRLGHLRLGHLRLAPAFAAG